MITHESVTFESTLGHELSGVVDLPPKRPEGYAVMVHCFTGGKDHHATRRISRQLTDRGLAVLRFDLTGLGESDGELAASTFSDDVADV
ncbi:MAG: alpha/beta hydrolase, partial [Nocardioidaceae bacterium]